MSKLSVMPVWVADFFSKTDHLTNEEQWAYLKLMMKTWARNCRPLPDNDRDIARLLNISLKRWNAIRPRIVSFFDLSEETWRQPHLEDIFHKVTRRKELRASAGSLGGTAKSNKTNNIEPDLLGLNLNLNLKKKKDSDSEDRVCVADGSAKADPIKDLFDRGILLLVSSGLPSTRARTMIGKWRKHYDDPLVLEAIIKCEDECATDPVPYITRCLAHHNHDNNGNAYAPLTPASRRFDLARQYTLDAALRAEREGKTRNDEGDSG